MTARINAQLTLNAQQWNQTFQQTMQNSTAAAQTAGAQIQRSLSQGANTPITPGGNVFSLFQQQAGRQAQQVGSALGGQINSGLRQSLSSVPILGSSLSALTGPAMLATAGLAAVGAALIGIVKSAEEYNNISLQLDAVLKSTGNKTGYSAEQLKRYAGELEGIIGVDEELIIKSEQVLASFDGIAGSNFKRVIESAANLSSTFGGDLTDNTEKIALVMQNLAQGSTDGLAKKFKILDKTTIDLIETLAKSGHEYEAQVAFMDALAEKTDGAAAAAGKTGLTGAIFGLTDAFGDLSRTFANDSGMYTEAVAGLNWMSEAVGTLTTRYHNLSRARAQNSALDTGLGVVGKLGPAGWLVSTGIAMSTSAGDAPTRTRGGGNAALMDQRQGEYEAMKSTTAAAAEGKILRAKEAGVKAGEAAAASAKREADAREKAAEAYEKYLTSLETGLQMETQSKDQQELISAEMKAQEMAAKAGVPYDQARVESAVLLTQALRNARSQLDAMTKSSGDLAQNLAPADDGIRTMMDARDAKNNAEFAAAEEALAERQARNLNDIQVLGDTFYDVFSGRSKDIWSNFKDKAKRTLADVAAKFVMNAVLNIGSKGGGIGGTLSSLTGAASAIGSAGSIGGAISGVGSSILGAAGLSGIVGTAGVAVPGVASLGGIGGGVAAGSGIAGMGAAGAAVAAAIPWVAAAVAAAVVVSMLIKGPTPRGFATLSTDGINGTRGRGKGRAENIAAAKEEANGVLDGLKAIADSFGGSIKSGVAIGEIGVLKDKFTFDPTPRAGKGVRPSQQVYATAEEAQSAAIAYAVSQGAISGISNSIKSLLGGGNIEKQLAKAQTLNAAMQAYDKMTNPVKFAVDELNKKYKGLVDIMNEAGSSTEEVAKAQAVYNDELDAIKASAKDAASTLLSFQSGLKLGSSSPLSLRDQEATAKAAFEVYAAQIEAGKKVDQGAFTDAAGALLDVERSLNASGDQFFSIYDRVAALTEKAIATATANSEIGTVDSPFIAKTADNTANIAANTENTNTLMQQQLDVLRAIFGSGFVVSQATLDAALAVGGAGGSDRGNTRVVAV